MAIRRRRCRRDRSRAVDRRSRSLGWWTIGRCRQPRGLSRTAGRGHYPSRQRGGPLGPRGRQSTDRRSAPAGSTRRNGWRNPRGARSDSLQFDEYRGRRIVGAGALESHAGDRAQRLTPSGHGHGQDVSTLAGHERAVGERRRLRSRSDWPRDTRSRCAAKDCRASRGRRHHRRTNRRPINALRADAPHAFPVTRSTALQADRPPEGGHYIKRTFIAADSLPRVFQRPRARSFAHDAHQARDGETGFHARPERPRGSPAASRRWTRHRATPLPTAGR